MFRCLFHGKYAMEPSGYCLICEGTPTGAPYWVVGNYKVPKGKHYGSVIGPAILDRIAYLDLEPKVIGDGQDEPGAWGPQMTSIWADWDMHAEVRRFAQPSGQGGGWHKDGDLEPNAEEVMDHAAVLWAEVVPTQFQTDDGTVWQPEPGQIVIANNLSCLHRCPPNTPNPPNRRWFFRQRVHVPEHLHLP